MRRALIGITAIGSLAMVAAAMAQDRGPGGPDGPFRDGRGPRGARAMMSDQDRSAFLDARIAGLHAGLKLNADQEKLWPPVEEALRGLAAQRREAQAARRERFMSMRQDDAPRDIPGQLRFMADRQAASADALRKLADAAAPLYGVLDEGQKRRLAVLSRVMGPGPGMRAHGRSEMRRGDMERGERFAEFRRGPGRGFGPRDARPQGAGPQAAGPQDGEGDEE